ncbi:alpha/beta fold hydrolase [Nocardia sp. NPDC004278]
MCTDSLKQIQQGGPFGSARFAIIRAAGHLPHLEQPEATFAHIEAFLPALR